MAPKLGCTYKKEQHQYHQQQMQKKYFLFKMKYGNKVVFILGATGSGKSRLSVDLALHFNGEIVNSDCIQFYEGLDILTNKIPHHERGGIPHHLLGSVYSDQKFTQRDFRDVAVLTIESIMSRKRLPIVVGGSNSYIQSLVSSFVVNQPPGHRKDDEEKSKSSCERPELLRYDCCFLWVDASLAVLENYVKKRIDDMIQAGLIQEIRDFYQNRSDYAPPLRAAIAIPEFAEVCRAFSSPGSTTTSVMQEEDRRKMMETAAVEDVKGNTCKLVRKQRRRIHEIKTYIGWQIHELDATKVLESIGEAKEASDERWQNLILKPSLDIVSSFLSENSAPDFLITGKRKVVSIDCLSCELCGDLRLRDARDRKQHRKSFAHRKQMLRLKKRFNATRNLLC